MHTSKTFGELKVGEAFVRAMAKRYIICVKIEPVTVEERRGLDDHGKRNAVILMEHAETFAPDCGTLLHYRDSDRVNVVKLKQRNDR